jgi:membrane-bound inhibitor of C-type lysozyme
MKGAGMRFESMKAALLAALLSAALSGCGSVKLNPLEWWSSGPNEQQPQRLVGATRYQCAGGKELAVRYAPQGQAWAMVLLPEREFRLDAVTAAAGRYSNGRATLDFKGDEVELQENGALLYAACKRVAG